MLLKITFPEGSNLFIKIMNEVLAEIDDPPKISIFMNVLFHAASLLMYRFYYAGSTFLRNFMPFLIISFQFILVNFDRKTGPNRKTTKIGILTNIGLRFESLFLDRF